MGKHGGGGGTSAKRTPISIAGIEQARAKATPKARDNAQIRRLQKDYASLKSGRDAVEHLIDYHRQAAEENARKAQAETDPARQRFYEQAAERERRESLSNVHDLPYRERKVDALGARIREMQYGAPKARAKPTNP